MNKDNYEVQRLKAVSQYISFDVGKQLEQIAKLASGITGMPISLITLMDENEQLILANEGIKLERLPRETSFCTHAIEIEELMVVEDATKDERFKNFPSVTGDLHIRFYASANLKSNDGFNIGTLCVYDYKPNHITVEQKKFLEILAAQVNNIFELNRQLGLSIKKSESLAKVAWVHAHKVRGPLSSIMAMTNLIRYDNFKFNKEYVLMLEKSAEELDRVITEVVESTGIKQ